MWTVSVRNTFLHCEGADMDVDAADEQPQLCRSKTAPAQRLDDDRRPTPSDASDAGQQVMMADVPEEQKMAPVLLGRVATKDSQQHALKPSIMAPGPDHKSDITTSLLSSHRMEDKAVSGRREARDSPLRTTVMLRNLPNNYTRDGVLELLDSCGLAGRYDFLYFPIDFQTHAAMGYAFVNLVVPEDAVLAHKMLDGFSAWTLPSGKVCRVTWSQPMQGLSAHVERYRNSPLMHDAVPDAYRPMLFRGGVRVSFPAPTKRIKPPRKGTQRMLL